MTKLARKDISLPFTPPLPTSEQAISYTQNLGRDFFGRHFRKEVAMGAVQSEMAQKQYEEDEQKKLLEFTEAYIQLALNLAQAKLQEEALSRAQERVQLIRRWVRDGLRRKVDLYQAEAGLSGQKEKKRSSLLESRNAFKNLSTLLHRPVLPSEIFNLRDSSFKGRPPPQGTEEKNKTLALLKMQERFLKLNLEKNSYLLWPSLKFTIGHRKWDSSALKNQDEAQLRLSLSWPLALSSVGYERAKIHSRLEAGRWAQKKTGRDIKETSDILKNQINLLDKNILSSQRRLVLSSKALKAYNELYRQGQANLDQVIRAEEALIETEAMHIRHLATREGLVYRLSYLLGELTSFLLEHS